MELEPRIRRGVSGGLLSVASFLTKQDRTASRDLTMRVASSNIREAAKEGLQSLYADPDEFLETYKDSPVINNMDQLKKEKLLWVKARTIDADVVNANGDYFSEEELLKEVDIQGKKMPAYKTFEGVSIFTNHKNDDVNQSKGMIVHSEWDDKEKCVYCIFYIDEEAYPDIARGIRVGYMHDVSMGCFDGNQRIFTDNGAKCIKDVLDSDKLFDTNGNLVDIINRQEYDHFHDMRVITLEGGFQIKCTDYHPFLTFTEEEWKGRKSLKRPVVNGKKTSQWVENEITPAYRRVNKLNIGDLLMSPIGGEENFGDPDFTIGRARLAGYFAAEGSYDTDHKRKRIFFTFNIDEKDTSVSEVVSLLSSEFSVDAHVLTYEKSNSIKISLTNKEVYNWFFENCGRYSKYKKFHSKWLIAPLSIQLHLISAYIAGDGSATYDARNNTKTTYLRSNTISQELFEQISFILTRLGIHHSVYFPYRGKKYTQLEAVNSDKNINYTIQIPSFYAALLQPGTWKEAFASSIKTDLHTWGDYLTRKIINIETIPIDHQKVYTFQTATGNYLAQNFISRNCQVEFGRCSECNKKAVNEKDYCDHMKKYKGKNMPGTSKKAYEKNYGLKFIELSVVGDGAFENCTIDAVYDVDEILSKAVGLEKQAADKAEAIFGNVMLAEAMVPVKKENRQEFENLLRNACTVARIGVKAATSERTRFSQTAGTLVGGALLAGDGANQNNTVSSILQFLGIDPRSNLNVLDMLNLALNFLEVGVMQMFSRKDNIDLTHVQQVTKAMADLQKSMGDMIDDGVGSNAGAAKAPLNQGQLPGGQGQPGAPQQGMPQQGAQGAIPTQQQGYQSAGSVGQMVSPMLNPMPGFTGAGAKKDRVALANEPLFVWLDDEDAEPIARSVFASTKKEEHVAPETLSRQRKVEALAKSIATLKVALDIKSPNATNVIQDAVKKASDNTPTKNSALNYQATGESSMDNLNLWGKFIANRRKIQASKVSQDLKVQDEIGNKVVLSSDGSITGYYNNERVASYKPVLNNEQLNDIENDGGLKVAQQLLDDLAVRTASWNENHDTDTVMEEQLEKMRKGTDDDVKEALLGDKAGVYKRNVSQDDLGEIREETLKGDYYSNRRPTDKTVKENLLDKDAGLYGRKNDDDADGDVKEHLMADARKGNPDKVIEQQLAVVRENYQAGPHNLSKESAKTLTEAAVKALSTSVVAARVLPEEIMQVTAKLAERKDFAELLVLAKLGAEYRKSVADRKAFHKIASANVASESALLDAIGNVLAQNVDINAYDLAETLHVACTDNNAALSAVTRTSKTILGDNQPGIFASTHTPSRSELIKVAFITQSEANGEYIPQKLSLRSAISALSSAAAEVGAHPKEVVAAINETEAETLLSLVTLAATKDVTTERLIARARTEFYGSVRQASKQDVFATAVGYLADYASAYNVPIADIVGAVKYVTNTPTAAERLVTKLITVDTAERTAAIQVTENRTQSREIHCTLDDLGGLDPKSEDFEQGLTDFAKQVMGQIGWQVDDSFALTNVDVNGQGVTASVQTTFRTSFDAANPTSINGATSPIDSAPAEGLGVGVADSTPPMDSGADTSLGDQGAAPADPATAGEEEGPIQTASYKALMKTVRQARRNELLARFGQALPGMGGAPGGGAGGGMGGAGMDPSAAAGADGPGMSALTTPPPPPGDDPTDADSMPEPGKKQPIGKVCPQCGSDNTEFANGQGSCKECGTDYKVEYNITITPSDDSKADSGADQDAAPDAGAPPPLGPDAGLGAATAPAPAPAGGAAGAPPMGGMGAAASASTKNSVRLGSAGVMAKVKWRADTDVFAKFAEVKGDRSLVTAMPVGFVCPSCGNREASKIKNRTWCYECGTVGITKISAAKDAQGRSIPGKVDAEITTIL